MIRLWPKKLRREKNHPIAESPEEFIYRLLNDDEFMGKMWDEYEMGRR